MTKLEKRVFDVAIECYDLSCNYHAAKLDADLRYVDRNDNLKAQASLSEVNTMYWKAEIELTLAIQAWRDSTKKSEGESGNA